jgi:hypothetical protein
LAETAHLKDDDLAARQINSLFSTNHHLHFASTVRAISKRLQRLQGEAAISATMAPTAAAPAAVAPSAGPRENEEDATSLMSFSFPRSCLSPSLSAAEQSKDQRRAVDGRDESAELLAYYRRRCDEFQGERQRMLGRLAEIEARYDDA